MDEILVHISAPATRQDDDLYRSLIDAYFDFEPCELVGCGRHERGDDPGGLVNPPLTTSDESYGSLPSHMSSGRDSKGSNQRHQFSFNPNEDSILPRSRLEQLERLHAKWKRQNDPGLSAISAPPSPTGIPTSRNKSSSFIEDSQLAAHAIESQIYDGGSITSEDTSEDETHSSFPVKTVTSLRPSLPKSPTTLFGRDRDPAHPSLKTASLDLPTTSRVESDVQQSPTIPTSAYDSVNPFQNNAHASIGGTLDGTAPTRCLEFRTLPFEAFPPAPKVSVECPVSLPSQVTKYLEAIKQQNPRRFKPSKTLRPVDNDERGYWLVECVSWPLKIQYDFWSSLCDHVRSGRFGWGVTLHRELPGATSKVQQMPVGLGQARLYCWGEVVEHMWLYLWLCSKGMVSGSGSRWLDAEDTVVIVG